MGLLYLYPILRSLSLTGNNRSAANHLVRQKICKLFSLVVNNRITVRSHKPLDMTIKQTWVCVTARLSNYCLMLHVRFFGLIKWAFICDAWLAISPLEDWLIHAWAHIIHKGTFSFIYYLILYSLNRSLHFNKSKTHLANIPAIKWIIHYTNNGNNFIVRWLLKLHLHSD
jgi:hypothetical protein